MIFPIFICIKIRGEMFKSLEKWKNNGFGGCEKLRYAK